MTPWSLELGSWKLGTWSLKFALYICPEIQTDKMNIHYYKKLFTGISMLVFGALFIKEASSKEIPNNSPKKEPKTYYYSPSTHYGPMIVLSAGLRLNTQGAFFSHYPFGLSYLTKNRYSEDYKNMTPVINPDLLFIFQFSKTFSIVGGLIFMKKGSDIPEIIQYNPDSLGAFHYRYYNSKRTFNYFGFPSYLLIHYPYKDFRFMASVGISTGKILSSQEDRKYTEEGKDSTINWKDFTNDYDFALVTSGGVEFGYKKQFSYIFMLSFSAGLNSIYKNIPSDFIDNETFTDMSYKHYLLGATLGVNYNFAYKRFRTGVFSEDSF